MTEREILKKLVRIVDSGLGLEGDIRTILNTEARDVLRQFADPPPEHPAIVAYREWTIESPCVTQQIEIFLAGWKRALVHITENFEDNWTQYSGTQIRKHLTMAGNATPERLP